MRNESALQLRSRILALLLLLSGLTLSSLVPGGPIENRDFSHLSPALLLAFNVFLTGLGLGSFLLIPAVLRQSPQAARAAFYGGVAYLLVYAVDLLGWFPPTHSPMSSSLRTLEITGLVLGLLLCAGALYGRAERNGKATVPGMDPLLFLLLLMVAVTIIAFATWSAMSGA